MGNEVPEVGDLLPLDVRVKRPGLARDTICGFTQCQKKHGQGMWLRTVCKKRFFVFAFNQTSDVVE